MTNGDKIRTMTDSDLTDDELVELFDKLVNCDNCLLFGRCMLSDLECNDFLKEWIQEADDE